MGYLFKIDHPLASAREDSLHSLSNPDDDFPVVTDASGKALCTYRSTAWPLWPYGGESLIFGDHPKARHRARLDGANADLQRRIALWLLWGDHPTWSPITISGLHQAMRPILHLCSQDGIPASKLLRFPAVMAKLAEQIAPSQAHITLPLLQNLYSAREALGFVVLDYEAIEALRKDIPAFEPGQHPYVPPRIHSYVGQRLLTMLDDYLAHREPIEALFRRCLDAYVDSFGGAEAAFGLVKGLRRQSLSPFTARAAGGSFYDWAQEAGLAELFERWVVPPGEGLTSVVQFSSYLTAVQFVGRSYVTQYSGMRRKEAGRLRSSCLRIDDDPVTGRVVTIRSATTKTVQDKNAMWVVVPSAERAVAAMKSVARLRTVAAQLNPRVQLNQSDVDDPPLAVRSHEPWASRRTTHSKSTPKGARFDSWSEFSCNLFDDAELTVTEEDWRIAQLMTSSLNRERYGPGRVWPLAYHPMRRTLLVNASHTGVSLESLQIQAQHADIRQTEYYRNNYSRLAENGHLKVLLLEEQAKSQVSLALSLTDTRFVSPLGEKHKASKIEFIAAKSQKQLLALAKTGKLAIRETLCGICMYGKPCQYGGLDHLEHCVGGADEVGCPDALIDANKLSSMEAVTADASAQLGKLDGSDNRLKKALTRENLAARKAIGIVTQNGNCGHE